jgi:hypothetical protein
MLVITTDDNPLMSDLGSILFVSKVNQRHMTSLGWLLTDGYDTAMKWIAAHFFF